MNPQKQLIEVNVCNHHKSGHLKQHTPEQKNKNKIWFSIDSVHDNKFFFLH